MKVPIAKDGGIQHYPEKTWVDNPDYDGTLSWTLGDSRCAMSITVDVTWNDVGIFYTTLTLKGMERARSAAYFMWVDHSNGRTYPMFMKDMLELLQNGAVVRGEAMHFWTPQKRGQNYGIKMCSGT